MTVEAITAAEIAAEPTARMIRSFSPGEMYMVANSPWHVGRHADGYYELLRDGHDGNGLPCYDLYHHGRDPGEFEQIAVMIANDTFDVRDL